MNKVNGNQAPATGRVKAVRKKCRLLLRPLAKSIERCRSTPDSVRNRGAWALRRALLPYVKLPMWVASRGGAKFYLGSDPVDDLILEDVLKHHLDLYFPAGALEGDGARLVLDIGAHHGFVVVEMLRRYPGARVIAVEPNPAAIGLLKKNLEANNFLDRVEIVEGGVGPQDGVGFLTYVRKGSWEDTTLPAEGGGEGAGRGVQVRISTLASILGGRKPALVKCNAEGAEYYLFPQLFAMGVRPEFIILMAHPEHGSVEDLKALLREAGYGIKEVGSGPGRPRFHCCLQPRP